YDVSITALRDRRGEVVGRIIDFRDVTALQRATRALRAANAELEQLVQALELRNKEISLLSQLAVALQGCRTANEAYSIMSPYLARLFPTVSGAIGATTPENSTVEPRVWWGESPPLTGSFVGPNCYAFRSRVIVHENDSRLACLTAHCAFASVCIPLATQTESIGVMALRYHDARPDAAIRQLAVTVGEHMTLALANIRMRENLRGQSIRDPLTGLFNRRYLEEALKSEVARSFRDDAPFGVIMVDLDYFKRFNDCYGHSAGDAALRLVAQFLQASIRAGDIACRYGGEEFTLILPGATLSDTSRRAEQIRRDFPSMTIPIGDELASVGTLSVGVAAFPDHGRTAEQLLEAADAALYQAKRAGRNCVALARER
ncbi:MAG: GGDEF domain-containing protein, partial [Dehalococcoidia bacterium]|nr:GGDEF domain-containing protein [Dehalococcoidia bacterium]